MGNKLARSTQASPSEYYLNDLPSEFNLVLKETLGANRVFKSILCVHDEGLLLVKVYFKRGDLDLKEHARKLSDIRDKLRNIENSHVWPFQRWHETDRAAYLLRQYVFNSLRERFSTCPSLSMIEKKWLAFQLLHAVKQSHDRGVCHGDIKCENVLLTSWGWVYLTDYASFKPTYILDDNPADFSFFFDTGTRRRCYLAPERFYDPKTECSLDAPLRPSMDMFSLGCVLAELFLGGQVLFDLSQLLAYRKKLYDPKPVLEEVADPGIRNMILQMIHLEPESRLSCDEYLDAWAYDVFPDYFSPATHKLFSCLPVLESDARVAVIHGAFPEIRKQMIRDAKVKALPVDALDKGGTHLPSGIAPRKSWPGSSRSTQEDLMTDINLLMKADTQPAQRVGRQYEEERTSFGCSFRLKAAAAKMSEVASMHDVSTEEVYENSLREPDGIFGDVFYTPDCVENYKFSGKTCRKEEYLLPDGGWVWEGDWQVDYKWPTVDNEGWRYCRFTTVEDGRPLPSAWTPLCTFDCLWKQRRWIRKRKKSYCQLQLPTNKSVRTGGYRSQPDYKCEGMVLIALALCSCLRHVKHPLTRREAVQLLHDASMLCDDDARLQLIVPYVAAMLSDSAAIVRCAALQTLCNVLSVVQSFSPSDAKVFPEYIFPLLSMLPDDPEESVRVCYADCIHKIASTAQRFLRSGALVDGKPRGTGIKHDTELAQLRETIGRIIHDLVMGQKQTPTIRRALLQHIAALCEFFGRKQCNDFLLPVLPAFLNDRDKQLRALFFEQIVHVCVFVGEASTEAYLLPYLEQALSNVEETVIVNALECIAALCVHRLLKKRVLLKTVERASPLLCHPSQWVRRAAITLVAASSSNLHPTDAYAYLIPILSPFLRREPAALSSETALMSCLKPPVSRDVFQQVLSDVMLSLTSAETTEQSKQRQKDPHAKATAAATGKLQKLKLHTPESEDGVKLKAMEGYIRNLSSTMHSWELENPEKLDTSTDITADGVIPLYSRPLMDKKLESSHIEEWSRVNRQNGGAMDALGYSQWSSADAGDKSIISYPSKYMTGSIYGGTPLGSKRDGLKESIMSFKPPLDVNVNRAPSGPPGEVSGDAFVKFLKTSASESSWKPRGVLIAHLQEHQRAVNQVAVSADNVLFASASNDGVVKVWDCRRLERDVSFKSKLSYTFENQRVLSLAMLTPDHQIAAASSGGEIHVFCVDYTARAGNSPERYSGVSNIRKIEPHEGPISTLQSFNVEDVSMLLYSTQRSGIHLWDFRMPANVWSLKAKLEQEYIAAVAVDPAHKWFVSGTSRGVLTLWDLRFLIQVHSWQLPSYHPVEAMTVPPGDLSRPFVYVAAGREELAVWNMENGTCQQLLKTNGHELGNLPYSLPQWRRNPITRPRQPQEASKLSEYRVDELNDPPARVPGIRALLPFGGSVITGGTDCRIRMWSHTRPETSYCVCGPTVKHAERFKYTGRKLSGVYVTQESGIKLPAKESGSGTISEAGVGANDPAGCHRDSITSLAVAETSQRLLISSSRDGVIKVWK